MSIGVTVVLMERSGHLASEGETEVTHLPRQSPLPIIQELRDVR
jgi:hypothetical protein